MQSIEGIDEHNLYPVHESSTPPPTPEKYWQIHYLTGALQAHLPGRWVISGSCFHYLEEGYCQCTPPDLAVVSAVPSKPPSDGYESWTDPPLLFAAEVEENFPLTGTAERGVPTFVELLEVPEYLYVDPPTRGLWLWRRDEDRYHLVPPEANGRLRSEQLDLSFGCDKKGFLRLYTAEGELLLTHEEQTRQAEAAAVQMAELERRLSELTAEVERLRRRDVLPG